MDKVKTRNSYVQEKNASFKHGTVCTTYTTRMTDQHHLSWCWCWFTFTTWPLMMPTHAASRTKNGVNPLMMVPCACIKYSRHSRGSCSSWGVEGEVTVLAS